MNLVSAISHFVSLKEKKLQWIQVNFPVFEKMQIKTIDMYVSSVHCTSQKIIWKIDKSPLFMKQAVIMIRQSLKILFEAY